MRLPHHVRKIDTTDRDHRSRPASFFQRDRVPCARAQIAVSALIIMSEPGTRPRRRCRPLARGTWARLFELKHRLTTTNSGAPVMSQVRTRLAAGASRIRTLGPTPSLAGRQTARTRLTFPPSKFIAPVEALAAVSVPQSSNAATLVSSAASAPLGQTLFHRYLGHSCIGGRFFKNHIQFHHVHYARDHVVSTHYLDNGDNNTLFFFTPVVLVCTELFVSKIGFARGSACGNVVVILRALLSRQPISCCGVMAWPLFLV